MGNGKAKGHLGSLLENTCETIIRVEKDKNNRSRSIVSPKEMRGEEFDSFVIEMDFQGIPLALLFLITHRIINAFTRCLLIHYCIRGHKVYPIWNCASILFALLFLKGTM